MVRMGFGRAEAQAALSRVGNDIMAAINHMVDANAAPQGGGSDARPVRVCTVDRTQTTP